MRSNAIWQPLIAATGKDRGVRSANHNPARVSELRRPNGIIAALSRSRSHLPLKIVGEGDIDVPAGKFRACIFGEKKMTACLPWPTFGLSAESARSRKTVRNARPAAIFSAGNTIELVNLPRHPKPNRSPKKETEASISSSSDGRSTQRHFQRRAANRGALAWSWPAKKMPGSAPFGLRKILDRAG